MGPLIGTVFAGAMGLLASPPPLLAAPRLNRAAPAPVRRAAR
jgi:hypothetical protein